jgi:rhamnogalacturonyl hydrolase YesR
MINTSIHISFQKLKSYCEHNDFKGYDPYDGLNSTFFQRIPFIPKSKLARLIWIQVFKRSPLNLRKLVGIKKEHNPKAMGLFLTGYCHLYRLEPQQAYLDKIHYFVAKIASLQSKGYSGSCWGYNFDWQAKAFFQPKHTPTIVASSFVANALLDAYEITKNEECLTMARSTCDFILQDLNRTSGENNSMAFSYSPVDNSVVYNASLLGAKLLSRVYSITKEMELKNAAAATVAFCSARQKEDGSWSYGTLPFHQWIDNFHTGYNLECIAEYMKYTGDKVYANALKKGFDYYLKTFFLEDGRCKYYSDNLYPIDIHAPSQLIVTLFKLDALDENQQLAEKVLQWTIDHMQSNKGYFYYQINRYITSKIPYMRWSQAWMFVSMSVYLSHFNKKNQDGAA